MVVGWARREQREILCRALLTGVWGAWSTSQGSDVSLALGPRGLELGREAEAVNWVGQVRGKRMSLAEARLRLVGSVSVSCCRVTNSSLVVDGSRYCVGLFPQQHNGLRDCSAP